MSSLLINIQITKTDSHLELDEDDILDYQHRVSKFSPTSPTSGSNSSTLSPHCSPRLDCWSYPSDGSVVSEGSVSSAQSDTTTEFSISTARQDSIGTLRRPDARYPEGVDRVSAAPGQAPGYEREKFDSDLSATQSKRKEHQRLQYGSTKASCSSYNVEDMHHRRYAADLIQDEDEYLPRRAVTPHIAIAPPPIPLPRLYAHNPRFRACADDAVRRMRTETLEKELTPPAAQNPYPVRKYSSDTGGPYQPTRRSLRTQENSFKPEHTIDGPARPENVVRGMRAETLDKRFTPTTGQNPHPFRNHPFPIGGPNPFRHTRQSRHNQGNSFKHVVEGVERLVEDDEEIIVYLDSHLAAERIAVAVAEEERMLQEVRPRKHRPAVLNQRAHNYFLAQRRLLSPPETRRRLDEPEVESFDDFPVCEMSIAMGLHDQSRSVN